MKEGHTDQSDAETPGSVNAPLADEQRTEAILLAECPEFSLWEEPDGFQRVVLSDQVQQALDRFEFRINDTGSDSDQRNRIRKARAMELFLYFAGFPTSPLRPEDVALTLKDAFYGEISGCFERRVEQGKIYEWLDVDNMRLEGLAASF